MRRDASVRRSRRAQACVHTLFGRVKQVTDVGLQSPRQTAAGAAASQEVSTGRQRNLRPVSGYAQDCVLRPDAGPEAPHSSRVQLGPERRSMSQYNQSLR